MDSCENVTFLILRNTFIISDYLRIFSKFSLKNVFQQNWDRDGFWLATTVYRLYHQKTILSDFLGFQLFVSCHLIGQVSWSGLWLVHLMITGHMTGSVFQYSPLLTRQSRLISDFITYYYCLPYIYNFCLRFFDGCGENIKYKDFALNNRQSVFGN